MELIQVHMSTYLGQFLKKNVQDKHYKVKTQIVSQTDRQTRSAFPFSLFWRALPTTATYGLDKPGASQNR